jgi:hypothetical protein
MLSTDQYNIASAIRLYHGVHGRWPTNWPQLEKSISVARLNEIITPSRSGFPLQRHYVFVPLEWNLQNTRGESILMIRNSAFREEARTSETSLGRYVVILSTQSPISESGSTNTSSAHLRWISESRVQDLLALTDKPLPPIDVQAAESAESSVIQKLKEQRQFERTAEIISYKLQLMGYLDSIRGWFIAPPGTNALGGSGAAPVSRRIKIVPVSVLVAALVVIVALAHRVWIRR